MWATVGRAMYEGEVAMNMFLYHWLWLIDEHLQLFCTFDFQSDF